MEEKNPQQNQAKQQKIEERIQQLKEVESGIRSYERGRVTQRVGIMLRSISRESMRRRSISREARRKKSPKALAKEEERQEEADSTRGPANDIRAQRLSNGQRPEEKRLLKERPMTKEQKLLIVADRVTQIAEMVNSISE